MISVLKLGPFKQDNFQSLFQVTLNLIIGCLTHYSVCSDYLTGPSWALNELTTSRNLAAVSSYPWICQIWKHFLSYSNYTWILNGDSKSHCLHLLRLFLQLLCNFALEFAFHTYQSQHGGVDLSCHLKWFLECDASRFHFIILFTILEFIIKYLFSKDTVHMFRTICFSENVDSTTKSWGKKTSVSVHIKLSDAYLWCVGVFLVCSRMMNHIFVLIPLTVSFYWEIESIDIEQY